MDQDHLKSITNPETPKIKINNSDQQPSPTIDEIKEEPTNRKNDYLIKETSDSQHQHKKQHQPHHQQSPTQSQFDPQSIEKLRQNCQNLLKNKTIFTHFFIVLTLFLVMVQDFSLGSFLIFLSYFAAAGIFHGVILKKIEQIGLGYVCAAGLAYSLLIIETYVLEFSKVGEQTKFTGNILPLFSLFIIGYIVFSYQSPEYNQNTLYNNKNNYNNTNNNIVFFKLGYIIVLFAYMEIRVLNWEVPEGMTEQDFIFTKVGEFIGFFGLLILISIQDHTYKALLEIEIEKKLQDFQQHRYSKVMKSTTINDDLETKGPLHPISIFNTDTNRISTLPNKNNNNYLNNILNNHSDLNQTPSKRSFMAIENVRPNDENYCLTDQNHINLQQFVTQNYLNRNQIPENNENESEDCSYEDQVSNDDQLETSQFQKMKVEEQSKRQNMQITVLKQNGKRNDRKASIVPYSGAKPPPPIIKKNRSSFQIQLNHFTENKIVPSTGTTQCIQQVEDSKDSSPLKKNNSTRNYQQEQQQQGVMDMKVMESDENYFSELLFFKIFIQFTPHACCLINEKNQCLFSNFEYDVMFAGVTIQQILKMQNTNFSALDSSTMNEISDKRTSIFDKDNLFPQTVTSMVKLPSTNNLQKQLNTIQKNKNSQNIMASRMQQSKKMTNSIFHAPFLKPNLQKSIYQSTRKIDGDYEQQQQQQQDNILQQFNNLNMNSDPSTAVLKRKPSHDKVVQFQSNSVSNHFSRLSKKQSQLYGQFLENDPNNNSDQVQQIQTGDNNLFLNKSIIPKNSNFKKAKKGKKGIQDVNISNNMHENLESLINSIWKQLSHIKGQYKYEVLDYRYFMPLQMTVINEETGEKEVKEFEATLIPCIYNHTPSCFFMFKDTGYKKEIQKLNEIQENSTKMSQNVAHEFRTPLNCILSMLEVVKDQLAEDVIDSFIQPAINSGKQLLSLVNDMLDFAQIREGKFKINLIPFRIRFLLLEIYKTMKQQASMKKIKLFLKVQEEVPEYVTSDENRIRQITLNLIQNALKFTEKGSIQIEATQSDDNIINIAVKDTGIGIKQEDIGKLCSAFGKIELDKKQSHLNTQGVGLGLMISNTLAQNLVYPQSDGEGLKITSEVGKGSTFAFNITDHQIEEDQIIPQTSNCTNISTNNQQGSRTSSNHVKSNATNQEIPIESSIHPAITFKAFLSNFGKSVYSNNCVVVQSQLNQSVFMNNYFSQATNSSDQTSLQLNYMKPSISLHTNSSKQDFMPKNGLGQFKISEADENEQSLNVIEKDFDYENISTQKRIQILQDYKKREMCSCCKILIVDDNVYSAYALERIIDSIGFKSDIATSLKQAKEKLTEKMDCDCCISYSLFFSDYNLGDGNGLDVTKAIIEFFDENMLEGIPIIFGVSGEEDMGIAEECIETGMQAFLIKPIVRTQVVEIIDSCILYKLR